MDPINTPELAHLTKSAILERNDNSSLALQFLQSAAYSGAEAPLRALAQAADQVKGGHSADDAVKSGFKAVGVEQPKPAEFGTSSWMVQQVGGAAGMMLPFLALRSAVKYGAGKVFSEAALDAGTQSLAQTAMREAAVSGTTGLLYGSILSPSSEANVGTSSFYADRAKAGLANAATFAALSAASPYVSKGMDAIAAASETSSLLPAALSAPLATAIRFPLVTGMVSGVPSGIVSAETNALKDGKLLPSGDELKQSIASMSVVGGVMGTAQWLLDRASTTPQERAEAEVQQRLANALRQRAAEESRAQAASADERVLANAPDRHAGTQESQRANAQIGQVMSGKPSDAILEDLVDQAMKRMAALKQGRSAELTPEESLMDAMAKSTVTRAGLGSGKGSASEDAESQAAKPADPNLTNADANLPGLEIVLGASGSETTAHAGFLQAIEDNKVPVSKVTGASGGSLVAALYTNHYSPAEIKDILLSDQFRYPRIDVLAKCFHVMDPWNLFPYAMDFRPWLQDFVDTYKLKPQENLRIVAADSETHAPIVFEGTNYDLTTALAASTAATPALGLKPVQVNGRTAIDGFYYHPIPAALTNAPAIVSKIGFVKEPPSEALTPWDYFMHLKEMAYYNNLKNRYPDPPGHIIAETGLPDVATTTFGLSTETLEKLVDHGYEATNERLHQPDAVKAIEEARKAVEAAKKTQK